MRKKSGKPGIETLQIKKKREAPIKEATYQVISDLEALVDKGFDELERPYLGKEIGKPGQRLREVKKKQDVLVEETAHRLIRDWEAHIGKPFDELERPFLVRLITSLLEILCEKRTQQLFMKQIGEKEIRDDKAALAKVADAVVKRGMARRLGYKKRVENRPDQVDKRAFQEAVLANIERYSTIADAVRDLQTQFPNRRAETLQKWASKVWPSERKVGRPPKKEN